MTAMTSIVTEAASAEAAQIAGGLSVPRRGAGRAILPCLMACAVLLGGCAGSLLESDMPVSSIYVLRPAPPMEVDDAAAPGGTAEDRDDFPNASLVDLSIGRPHLAPGLDTDRIAVIRDRQLDYYRAARWGARAADVVQSLLVDTLQDRRAFNSVTAEQARVAAAYLLDVDVRDFQAEYAGTGAPAVRVHFMGRLIRVADRSLVATFEAQSRQQVSENRLSEVVAAFESAARAAALTLTRQAASAIDRDAGAQRPAGASR